MATLPADFQYTRWSDSIERSVMNQVLSNGEAVSMKDIGGTMLKSCKKIGSTLGNAICKMAEAIYEARAKEARRLISNYY